MPLRWEEDLRCKRRARGSRRMQMDQKLEGETLWYEWDYLKTNLSEQRWRRAEESEKFTEKKEMERQIHRLLLMWAGNSIVYSTPHSASQWMSAVCEVYTCIHECIYKMDVFKHGSTSLDECLISPSLPLCRCAGWFPPILLQPVFFYLLLSGDSSEAWSQIRCTTNTNNSQLQVSLSGLSLHSQK